MSNETMVETAVQGDKGMMPDSSGTVGLTGHEKLVDEFMLKDQYLKLEAAAVESLKERLRSIGLGAVRAAKAAGAKRAFLRASRRGGVAVTMPDYDAAGNRLAITGKKEKELFKLGGLEKLGLQPEEVFEEERIDEGGEVIELRGKWVEWFKSHYEERLTAGDPNIKWDKREPQVVKRLRAGIADRLEAAAAAGSEIAQFLVSAGLKSAIVKAEEV